MANKGLGYILTFTGGIIGGLALGMLLSPKTGKENRAYLKKGASEARHKVKDVARDIKKNLPDLYEATDKLDFNVDDVMTISK